MELNEIKIKGFVRQYQESTVLIEQQKILENFRKEVELYLYHFPKLTYKRSQDECAGFYLYVLERLHTIIKNFPLESSVKFKTWFNYVLKNQYVNFYRKNKGDSQVVVSLEPMESEIAFEQEFYEEQPDTSVEKVIHSIPEQERVLIELYYMPERITAADLQWLSNRFGQPISRLLTLRNNLILIHEKDSQRIRSINDQLAEVNGKLVDLKFKMRQETDLNKKNALLLRIARGENQKFKLIRKLNVSEKKLFAEFILLFRNIRRAKEHLNFAKRRFRLAMIQEMKKKDLRMFPKAELF